MDFSTTIPLLNNSNTSSSNSTFARNENLAQLEVIVQSVILALAVLGNSTVLISLFSRRKSLTRMHLLMIHLSIADLFVAFGSVLPQLAWDISFAFKGGDILCRLVKYMQIVAIYASSYVLVMTAIDRYYAICFPLISHRWSSRMVHKMVVVAWTLSLIFSTPQLFLFSYKLSPYGMYDCWGTFNPEWTLPLYITTFTVLVYIIPTFILVFCYGSIVVVVWKSGKIGESQNRLSKHIRSIDTKNYKSNKFSSQGTEHLLQQNYTNGSAESRQSIMLNDIGKPNKCCGASGQGNVMKCSESNINHCKTNETQSEVRYSNVHFKCQRTITNSNTYSPSNTSASERRNLDRDDESATHHSSVKKRLQTAFSRQGLTEKRNTGHGITRAKLRTIKLMITVVICYMACWSPFFIAQMWAAYDETAPFYGAPYTIILLLASLNSCTNPWIYLFFSQSMSSVFRQCLFRRS